MPPISGAVPKTASISKEQKESVKKWGKVIARKFSLIPSILFERQQQLGLDPVDFNILIQIVSFWWRAADLPWPSKRLLAERTGVDVSTVRRHLTRLEVAGLIARVPRIDKTRGQQSNFYNLKPLAKRLAQEDAKKQVETKKKEDSKAFKKSV